MENGWFRLHRSVFSQDDSLWNENRPKTKWEAWVDLIGQAAFKDHQTVHEGKVITVLRGEVPVSERGLMARWRWQSRGKVRRFLKMLEDIGRIEWETSRSRTGKNTDQKTDHGLTLLTISNYERYQGAPELDGTTVETTDGTTVGPRSDQTEEGKERKEPPTTEIALLRERYSPEELSVIDNALADFASTRKTGRMADSIVLKELRYWAGFPVDQVIGGLRIYVERGYARDRKGEKYAGGIIRKHQGESAPPPDPHPYERLR